MVNLSLKMAETQNCSVAKPQSAVCDPYVTRI